MNFPELSLTDYIDTSWGSIYFENVCKCHFCSIVDYDLKRSQYGYECPNCGKASKGNIFHFPFSTVALVDIIHDMYINASEKEAECDSPLTPGEKYNGPAISIVVMYVTLAEVLFEHFLENYLLTHSLSPTVCSKLMKSFRNPREKSEKLFPVFFGNSFNNAVKGLRNNINNDLFNVLEFYYEQNSIRNNIVHDANVWTVNKGHADMIVESIPKLINLFVILHNELIVRKQNKNL